MRSMLSLKQNDISDSFQRLKILIYYDEDQLPQILTHITFLIANKSLCFEPSQNRPSVVLTVECSFNIKINLPRCPDVPQANFHLFSGSIQLPSVDAH